MSGNETYYRVVSRNKIIDDYSRVLTWDGLVDLVRKKIVSDFPRFEDSEPSDYIELSEDGETVSFMATRRDLNEHEVVTEGWQRLAERIDVSERRIKELAREVLDLPFGSHAKVRDFVVREGLSRLITDPRHCENEGIWGTMGCYGIIGLNDREDGWDLRFGAFLMTKIQGFLLESLKWSSPLWDNDDGR